MRISIPQAQISFKDKELVDAYQRAFVRLANRMDAEFRQIIQTPGIFDGFPQDIVDTGALLRSQKMTIIGIGGVRWDWEVDYAVFVHEGYTLRGGKKQEGRPWTEKAMERLILPNLFTEYFNQEINKIAIRSSDIDD